LNKINRALRETWPELSEGIVKIMAKLGGNEILAASESGFLNIHNFESPIQRLVVEAEQRDFVKEYVSVVAGTVTDRDHTLCSTSKLVRL